MEMLNSISSLLVANDDLWKILISWFSTWIVNYGWAIVVFTICLKLVLTPLDVYQRVYSQKQNRFMSVMQPELSKLQEKYANDRTKLNEETAKLYKRYNFSLGGMCGSMLLTMGISLLVFITLFASLRAYGNEMLYETYHDVYKTYSNAEAYTTSVEFSGDKDSYIDLQVKEKYSEQKKKYSWFWVKNVWQPDTNTSQFVDFDEFYNQYKDELGDKEIAKANYNKINEIILQDSTEQNGYYVLIILTVVVAFLTQYLSTKLMAPKGQKMNGTNVFMFIVIPISMLAFVLNNNAIFALYTITNSIMTALISTIVTLIMKGRNKGKSDEEIILSKKNVEVVEYSRNYKK